MRNVQNPTGESAHCRDAHDNHEPAWHGRRKSILFIPLVQMTMVVTLFFFGSVSADETDFKTGKAFEAALSVKIRWSSIGSPLGDQIRDLQQQSGIAIVRDRRIDPDRLVDVVTEFVPRILLLKKISEAIPDADLCLTEQLAFIGPQDAVHRLPILIENANAQANLLRKKLGAVEFRRLSEKRASSLNVLSEPRQILIEYARTAGFTIVNPDAIPHDVWAAGALPRMAFAETATILLNQFDLQIKFSTDSRELRIVPVNPLQMMEYRYTVGSRLKESVTAAWQQEVPTANIKWSNTSATVKATLQQHIQMTALLSRLAHSQSNSMGSESPIGSIRTLNVQLKAERATIGQLIEYFRMNRIAIEVADFESAATQAILAEIVQLSDITEKKPGSEFFPLIFGKHFKKVEVLDDRVILSRE